MYMLTALSADPLEELRTSSAPNKDELIARRIELLQLDVAPPLRWLMWVGGVASCLAPFAFECTLGNSIEGFEVALLLPPAMASTIRLVTAASILAIILGVVVGMVTALRQNSAFDIGTTFVSFFLYSLPSFLVAVLLKEFGAIGMNNFIQRGDPPQISLIWIIGLTVVSGLVWSLIVGGTPYRRLITFGVAGAATAAALVYMNLTNFFLEPSLGPVLLFLLIALTIVGVTALTAGLRNRRALIAAGIVGVIGYICYFTLQGLFDVSTIWTLLILGVVAIVVSVLVGFAVSYFGPDKGQVIRAAGITGFFVSFFVLIDRFMQAWPSYMANPRINGRPVATAQDATTGYSGDVWGTGIDQLMHFALPTISMLLVSFAFYTRFARAGLLEVFNQDYIRTARAKGLSEQTIVMRHAFRNMLIPLTTIIAADIGSLLGGALITERVFAIAGMGAMFNNGLRVLDLNPIMGYFLVIAILAIAFNFIADMLYAVLDPRVRVK
ncbi:ABC transporter permease [Agrococcus casei]|nr:ABC transporter permease [Agrococcus casei]